MASLSPAALEVINNFLHLPIPGHDVICPYFNNRAYGARGGLRVLVGKGSPQEIAEEAYITSLRDKVDLAKLSDSQLKEFLVNHNLGIDCSGLSYYVLDAEARARGLAPLKKLLRFRPTHNPLRKLIMKLRPVENVGVGTLAHENNSTPVPLKDARPGDMIIMLKTGPKHDYNHVLVVHEVSPPFQGGGKGGLPLSPPARSRPELEPRGGGDTGGREALPRVIHYTHSSAWSADGPFGHGVRQGKIIITDPTKELLEQTWEEDGQNGDKNETLGRARGAEQLEARRLKALV